MEPGYLVDQAGHDVVVQLACASGDEIGAEFGYEAFVLHGT
jgi:hypothetical protein